MLEYCSIHQSVHLNNTIFLLFPKICAIGLLRSSTINDNKKTENKEQEIITIARLSYIRKMEFRHSILVKGCVVPNQQITYRSTGTGKIIYEYGNEALR